MEITIKETVYKLRYSIRTLFVFEQVTGYAFKMETLMETYIFFYSMLLSSNPKCNLTFDEFIDECDNQPELIIRFQQYIAEVFAKQAQLSKGDDKESDKKK